MNETKLQPNARILFKAPLNKVQVGYVVQYPAIRKDLQGQWCRDYEHVNIQTGSVYTIIRIDKIV